MTDDTQTIAARLTADKLWQEALDAAKEIIWRRDVAKMTCVEEAAQPIYDRLSAHVETLTQQVAELEQKETGYKVAIENLKHSIRVLGDQINKDGAELESLRSRFEAKTDTNSLQNQLDIERQTNTRLTAEIIEAIEEMPACRRQHLLGAPLLEIVRETVRHMFWQQSRAEQAEQQRDAAHAALQFISDACVRLNDQRSVEYGNVGQLTEELDDIKNVADAALAASAPQKGVADGRE